MPPGPNLSTPPDPDLLTLPDPDPTLLKASASTQLSTSFRLPDAVRLAGSESGCTRWPRLKDTWLREATLSWRERPWGLPS